MPPNVRDQRSNYACCITSLDVLHDLFVHNYYTDAPSVTTVIRLMVRDCRRVEGGISECAPVNWAPEFRFSFGANINDLLIECLERSGSDPPDPLHAIEDSSCPVQAATTINVIDVIVVQVVGLDEVDHVDQFKRGVQTGLAMDGLTTCEVRYSVWFRLPPEVLIRLPYTSSAS